MKRLISSLLCAFALTVALPLTGGAQEYPDGPVSIVVGFAPGGTDDTGARALAPLLEEQLGVPVILDSRPGAAMQIALEHTWARPHDGQTILWNNQQYLSTIEASDPELPYASDQWVWLEVLQNDPTVIVVQSSSPWQSLEALLEDMEARPDQITVGLLTGSVQLLACKHLLEDVLSLSFREVPQQSGGPMRTSLVGGHLDVICTNSSETYNLGDEVRTLAIFSDKRSSLLPDGVPVNEVLTTRGLSDRVPELGAIRGLAVPRAFAENNPEAFAKLHEAYKAAVDSDRYRTWLEETGRTSITQSLSLDESNAAILAYNQFFLENRDLVLGE